MLVTVENIVDSYNLPTRTRASVLAFFSRTVPNSSRTGAELYDWVTEIIEQKADHSRRRVRTGVGHLLEEQFTEEETTSYVSPTHSFSLVPYTAFLFTSLSVPDQQFLRSLMGNSENSSILVDEGFEIAPTEEIISRIRALRKS